MSKMGFEDINSRFFKVDMNAALAACKLGPNQAATYLALAMGTQKDHRTTAWSAKAVEDRTGLKKSRAKDVIRQLDEVGLLRIVRGGTRPVYELQAFDNETPYEAWLPQAFVGTKEKRGPLETLRRQKTAELLEALLEIYSHTQMNEANGVDWRYPGNPSVVFTRKRTIRETREYLVHGFSGAEWRSGCTIKIHLLNQLLSFGMIAIVPHLVDHDGVNAQVIMPTGNFRNALDWERSIGDILQRSADALLQHHPYDPVKDEFIIPYLIQFPDVELVGIVRPFYLPMTAPTLDWSGNKETWMKMADTIGRLAETFRF